MSLLGHVEVQRHQGRAGQGAGRQDGISRLQDLSIAGLIQDVVYPVALHSSILRRHLHHFLTQHSPTDSCTDLTQTDQAAGTWHIRY